jgi:hypothetical protein
MFAAVLGLSLGAAATATDDIAANGLRVVKGQARREHPRS